MSTSVPSISMPLRTAIFYSYPASVNRLFDVEKAADWWCQYDFVVFGDTLQLPDHEAHDETRDVIAAMRRRRPDMRVFGYVDLGVSTQNLSPEEIVRRSSAWKEVGACGVFLDDAGYDFQTPRSRLNEAVDACHVRGLPVCVNAWFCDDILASTVDQRFNPTGSASHLGADDFILLESLVCETETGYDGARWADLPYLHERVVKALRYRDAGGPRVLASSTVDWCESTRLGGVSVGERAWEALQGAATFYGLDGYGLDTVEYATEGASIAQDHYQEYRLQPIATSQFSLSADGRVVVDELRDRSLQLTDEGPVALR